MDIRKLLKKLGEWLHHIILDEQYSLYRRLTVWCLVCILIGFVFGLIVGINNSTHAEFVEDTAIETTRVVYTVEETTTTKPATTKPTTTKTPEPETKPIIYDDVELIALCTMGEAEGESEYGQRLVIDTILNRVDSKHFPNTIKGVIYQPNQFEAMWNGRIDRCTVTDEMRQLVIEEMESRTNYDVVFFQQNKYSPYGTPLFKEGCHYFSKY